MTDELGWVIAWNNGMYFQRHLLLLENVLNQLIILQTLVASLIIFSFLPFVFAL